jgi:low temperature requirement protein LtrA
VAAVAQVGTHLHDDYSPAGLVRFSLLFLMIWWAWLGHTNFSTRFDLGTRPLVFAAWSLVAVLVDAATRRIHRLPR